MASKGKPEESLIEQDMISELPDPLICKILYHLPTKDAVRTSVLSTRWKTLWLWVPRLGLSYQDFQDLDTFLNYGDRFFDSNRFSCIEKVELNVDKNHEGRDDPSYVTLWIDATVKRKIQHLDVQSGPYTLTFNPKSALYHQMPLSLYICETLVSLKLLDVILPDSEFISLPCLKTLHLKVVWNATTLERLVKSCPVLEELDICEHLSDHVQVLRVISRSLKKLSIKAIRTKDRFLIDTPQLGFLSIESSLLESYKITNMDTDAKLVIHLGYVFGDFDETTSLLSNRNRFCSFLSGVSKIRDLTIPGDYTTGESCLKWLPTILESFPNLKSLTLAEWYHGIEYYQEFELEDMDEINFSYVPECLLSSLEFVDFHVPISSIVGEMNLVRYILENSAILKKITLRLHKNDCSAKKYELVKKILKIPRGSTKCEVVVFEWEKK